MKSFVFWEAAPCSLILARPNSSKLKVEVSSETSVDFQWSTRRFIPEDKNFLPVNLTILS
jgi:hypothetical protein